jgi:phosphate transport system protein
MKTQVEGFTAKNSLLALNVELEFLQQQLLDLTNLLINQLHLAVQALNAADKQLAAKVIADNQQVEIYKLSIDDEVESLIAKFNPVAGYVCRIILYSRVAVELKNIGDEIMGFAKLVKVLFDPNHSYPNLQLLADIFTIANRVDKMLVELKAVLVNQDQQQVYGLLQMVSDCQPELQKGYKHQLSIAFQNVRMTTRLLNIMQILKSLESCGVHCRNIAELIVSTMEIGAARTATVN